MTDHMRSAVAPAYLFLCVLLGGSPQGYWGTAILQLLAVGLICWAIVDHREKHLPQPARTLAFLIAATIFLGLVQLVPIPFGIWSRLPGREFIVGGYQILGLKPGPMPISLAPYDSIATLLALLPPLGMLAATLLLKAYKPAWLAASLIAGTIAAVLLGILQVSSPDPTTSPWYPYRISNFGVATGFFANSNHMASLLLVTIPFIAALGARFREGSQDAQNRTAGLALAVGALAVIVVGLLLNASLAGYGLGLPVLLASLLMLFGAPGRYARAGASFIGLATIVAVGLIWSRPVGSRLASAGAQTSISSRQQMTRGGVELIHEFGMAGSGVGTFAKLYPLTEDPNEVGRVYVNHAHNDYLELAVETGLPGLLLIVAFLIWWTDAIMRMLRSPTADQFAMAGAIASAAILLHSLVDYPLRTGTMSAIFAMTLALIIQSRRSVSSDTDLRPVRHLVVG